MHCLLRLISCRHCHNSNFESSHLILPGIQETVLPLQIDLFYYYLFVFHCMGIILVVAFEATFCIQFHSCICMLAFVCLVSCIIQCVWLEQIE